MRRLNQSNILDSRPPKPEELATAFKEFFSHKTAKGEVLDDIQAEYARDTLRSLRLYKQSNGKPWLSVDDLLLVQRTLDGLSAGNVSMAHQHLASLLVAELDNLLLSDGETSERTTQHILTVVEIGVGVLCKTGQSLAARDWLKARLESGFLPETEVTGPVMYVLNALAAQHVDEAAMLDALYFFKTEPMDVPSTMVSYYAQREELDKAQSFLDKMKSSSASKEFINSAVVAMLDSCTRLKDEGRGHRIIADYIQTAASFQSFWMAIFRFAAGTGRGVEEVDRMMTVMERRKPAEAQWGIDNLIINNLVEFAMARKDPYLAERFIALGEKRGVMPDARTFVLQMDYRLSVDDVDGALAAYQRIKSLPRADEATAIDIAAEIAAMNQLIQAMCSAERRYAFDKIMEVVDELSSQRQAFFEAGTVSCLCILHLRREEYDDVIDLLNTHAQKYSRDDRAVIRDAFVAFCLDKRNSIAKVWDAYMIFRQVFNYETSRKIRTAIMNEFYARRRPDMAFHVFEHMRNHAAGPQYDMRAKKETYVEALKGIAITADGETLEQVHNLMKLDPRVEPDTMLNNALMLAYIGVNNGYRALEVWEEIISSREGPSFNSIAIALRACEDHPIGGEKARAIWDRIIQLDINISREVFVAWVSCLAAKSEREELGKWIKRAGEFNVEVDVQM